MWMQPKGDLYNVWIMWNILLAQQLWLVMFMILLIIKWWPLQFVTCSSRTPKLNKTCGQSLMKPCWNIGFQNWIFKDSWVIAHKPIGILSKLFMVMVTLLSWWLIRNTHVYSIGLSCSIGTPNNWSNPNCKINTTYKSAKSLMEVNGLYATICCWWLSSRVTSKACVHELAN